MRKKVSEKGYTLLELLVAISIIGALIALSLASYSRAQAKSRDTRRHADLAIIKVALESYFNDHGSFPAEKNLGVNGEPEVAFGSPLVDNAGVTYMKKLPSDPMFNPSVSGPQYCYTRSADMFSYTLGADYETEVRECNPGTPTPVAATPPPVSPTPTATETGATPGPTNPPTSTPGPTQTPSGTVTPYCADCRRLVQASANPNVEVGYCCFSENPNGLYTNNSCQDPAAGTGDYVGMTGCSITCSASDQQRWRQIDVDGPCIDDSVMPGFLGEGQQVGGSCSVYGCGAVISYCTRYDLSGSCTKANPPGTPIPWYYKTSCLCY